MKTSLEEKIEENFGKIICKFPIIHKEWEMDNLGFIVENNGNRDLILTDHGIPKISQVKELQDKISEYKEIIQLTERAIFLLK